MNFREAIKLGKLTVMRRRRIEQAAKAEQPGYTMIPFDSAPKEVQEALMRIIGDEADAAPVVSSKPPKAAH